MTEREESPTTSRAAGGTEDDAEQPVWQQDFPYTSAGEEAVTRRAFTRYLIAGSGVFAATSLGAAAFTQYRDLPAGSDQFLIDVNELASGESHLFRYPGKDDPAVLVRLTDGTLRAFSQKCTHLGCVVFWEAKHEELVCPCHEGIFDAKSGQPTAGPPERPLPRIDLEVRQGQIWAVGVET